MVKKLWKKKEASDLKETELEKYKRKNKIPDDFPFPIILPKSNKMEIVFILIFLIPFFGFFSILFCFLTPRFYFLDLIGIAFFNVLYQGILLVSFVVFINIIYRIN